MYAVIRSGGKQYKVSAGNMLAVERIRGDVGDAVVFDKVLAVVNDEVHVGRPMVENATVHGTIVAQERAKKIVVFKKKRRKGYRRTSGHRQFQTRCRIDEIRFGSPERQESDMPGEEMMTPAPQDDTLQET